MTTPDLGVSGEEQAIAFLRTQGYTVIAHHVRFRGGEIDIIAQDGAWLVFVEVKTRTSAEHGRPEEAVTPAKMHKLTRAALFYLQRYGDDLPSWRIDVIAIDRTQPNPEKQIEHFKNVTL